MKQKTEIKSLSRKELINWVKENGFKGYRGKQIFNWIYNNGITDFKDMINLPESLIQFLQNNSKLNNLSLLEKKIAEDGTIKYLWKMSDDSTIESVYLPYYQNKRRSICISSQVGCKMNCSFCATGIDGFIRDLTTGEIIEQILKIQHDISEDSFGIPAITNIVYMGMGEPLANIDNVLKSIRIINDENGFNIGMRKITISTSGLVPEINYLASLKLQLGLAISLNAPEDKLRNEIMPINKKYPLSSLIDAARNYIEKTGRRITFEYVIIKNINDSLELAFKLKKLLKDINCHLNIIPVNPVPRLKIKRPSRGQIIKFKNILKDEINVTIREEKGVNIKAACGQLRYARNRRD
ncbi:MAG: 23S rRNA (adenine(2503)-C(2))-methyltransferase RlmN [Halanaerobiaceae bacterium]